MYTLVPNLSEQSGSESEQNTRIRIFNPDFRDQTLPNKNNPNPDLTDPAAHAIDKLGMQVHVRLHIIFVMLFSAVGEEEGGGWRLKR